MTSLSRRNGAEPAFPTSHGPDGGCKGMTKREYFAAMCMQGILANKAIGKLTLWSTAQSAVMYADQILECLERDAGDAAAIDSHGHDLASLAFPSSMTPEKPAPRNMCEPVTSGA